VEARVVNLKLGAALLVLDFPSVPLVYVSKTTHLLEYMNCNEIKPNTNSNELVLFAAQNAFVRNILCYLPMCKLKK
jgi:hypothetical protein